MKMLDGLLKSKFYSKCKSDIKLTRTRIEIIKKKRNATQKYLRNDIAYLLTNGLDYDAYGRAGGLLAEMNMSECYEMIDQYCELISQHLSAMDKHRECPEECREAASSLMYAAARFADLPELRDLRTLFSERYGNSLDYYVQKKFAEKRKSGLPSIDTKLQLLQDIAAEAGLEWKSKALENRLFTESTYNKFAKENNDSKYSLDVQMDGSVEKKGSTGKRYEFYPARDFNPEREKEREVPHEEDDDKSLKYKWIPPPYTKTEDKVEPTEASEAEENNGQDDPLFKAKPRSVRTRSVKPPPGQEIDGGSKFDEKEKAKGMNKDKAAVGQRILKFFDGGRDQGDEEEKILDRLLRYYSGKKEQRKDNAEQHGSREGPSRASSLPAESTGEMETPKTHTRANSMHADGYAHVHPKLPDYDEFVARLAAFRGK